MKAPRVVTRGAFATEEERLAAARTGRACAETCRIASGRASADPGGDAPGGADAREDKCERGRERPCNKGHRDEPLHLNSFPPLEIRRFLKAEPNLQRGPDHSANVVCVTFERSG